MTQKPSVPKGTRDFSPPEMSRRNYIFDTVKAVFQRYGFQCVETPAMENLSTLMGKYGEEGDKLLFKILNSGDFVGGVDEKDLLSRNSIRLTNLIAEKGLRYDLTVPFARYVVQHRHELSFPFKRYQVQPVWRADRPQKGRYREFYQCDADIVGSDSLLNELELVQMIDDVFTRLKINVVVKINNRKILAGIAEMAGEADRLTDITVAIDKLDKIGLENVGAELLDKGVSADAIDRLRPILELKGTTPEKLDQLEAVIGGTMTGKKGISEVKTLFAYIGSAGLKTEVELDLTLARGLSYYTGAIFEVKAKDVPMGSISGGGRYDDLTGIFGMPGVSGVGISFGADRIYDVMTQLDLFPEEATATTNVLFVNFGEREVTWCLPVVQEIRQTGISAEIFPDADKIKKQLAWADRRKIPFVVMAGGQEIAVNQVNLKNMRSGEQQMVPVGDLVHILSAWHSVQRR